jgi:lipopolysaccharide export system protein LptC
MSDVRVVFFTDKAKEIHLSAAKGVLDTKTHDMIFSDSVVVTDGQYTLQTAELHYDKKRHILYSNVHISIMDGESSLEADTMETDLNNNTTRLRGNVKGTFSETFDFFSGMGGGS